MKKITLKNVKAFFEGNFRYKLYYSKFRFLIRKHIKEQIEFRIRFMDNTCYQQGSCKICGCETIALQMANKSCPKPCYPEFMTKYDWNEFKEGDYTIFDSNGAWRYYPPIFGEKEELAFYAKVSDNLWKRTAIYTPTKNKLN